MARSTRMNRPAYTTDSGASIAPSQRPISVIIKRIEAMNDRYPTWKVFSDWVEMMALFINMSCDLSRKEERGQRFDKIQAQYKPEEVYEMMNVWFFEHLTNEYEEGWSDALGEIYHALELHNKRAGQYFTPYSICCFMAQLTLGDRESLKQQIAENDFMTVAEPACGSGALVIAAAQVLINSKINFQECMHVTACDISATCVHMAYVQLTMRGIPAVVVHGNTLTLEEWDRWYTPFHVLFNWTYKLKKRARREIEEAQSSLSTSTNVEQPPQPTEENTHPLHPLADLFDLPTTEELSVSSPRLTQKRPKPSPKQEKGQPQRSALTWLKQLVLELPPWK